MPSWDIFYNSSQLLKHPQDDFLKLCYFSLWIQRVWVFFHFSSLAPNSFSHTHTPQACKHVGKSSLAPLLSQSLLLPSWICALTVKSQRNFFRIPQQVSDSRCVFVEQTPGECVDGYRAQSLPFAYDTLLAFHLISLSQPRDVDFGNIISDRPCIMVNQICWKAIKASHILL